MPKNYYDVDVKQNNEVFKTTVKNVSLLNGSKRVLKEREKGNEAKLCYGFHEYKILSQYEIDLEEGIKITKDNIHLYYRFMSDKEKINYSHTVLNLMFNERMENLCEKLNITKTTLHDISNAVSTTYYKANGTMNANIMNDGKCLWYCNNSGTIGISYFGVEDILTPIDEYIIEVKKSSEYTSYISNSAE